MKKLNNKRLWISLPLAVLLIHFLFFSLPKPLFKDPYTTVLNDRNGELLSTCIAADEQWRFPQMDSVPGKFETCISHFEDEYFRYHPGVNPVSMFRALWQNLKAGKVISGGSTLSMQVIRLSRKGQDRTVLEKFYEIYLALRLELRYSKNEILSLYASHAPFGSNIVGLPAAAWRYYGRKPEQLSWSESATLAVLPNSPALIFPGKNEHLLRDKRNRVLSKLLKKAVIDSLSYQLALDESVPKAMYTLPQNASHLLFRAAEEHGAGKNYTSTVDATLQKTANEVVRYYANRYAGNGVYNMAALVMDVHTKEVLAYVGNSNAAESGHGHSVDIITSPRSTGSTLKPFLYAAMIDDGLITPYSILADVPTFIDGFAPKNFTKKYEGAVHANDALSRSLNVPAVLMLKEYKYERFHYLLTQLGMQSLDNGADHYGLSLILGGAEITMWELASMYGGLATTLLEFEKNPYDKPYCSGFYRKPSYLFQAEKEKPNCSTKSMLSAGAIWATANALTEVHRPGADGSWKLFSSSQNIAWKTGTSHGFRDAWSIGFTRDYLVAVWVGNANGEGRPGLIGVEMAAPVMFRLFDKLPSSSWFTEPKGQLVDATLCRHSGERAGPNCEPSYSVRIPENGKPTQQCPYCRQLFLDKKGLRVDSRCAGMNERTAHNWFVLPPVQEWYYERKNPTYRNLPTWNPNCRNQEAEQSPMQWIYPQPNAEVYVPKGLNGEKESLIFELAHRKSERQVFWHLDGNYFGTTQRMHQMAFSPEEGQHQLVVIDEEGNRMELRFRVMGMVE